MHNRYKPIYRNRSNTSVDVISLVSYLKFQGVLLVSFDVTSLAASFRSSGILPVAPKKSIEKVR